jgi:hypothetical protein
MNERLLKYLGITHNPHAISAAEPLWEEARALSCPRTWQASFSIRRFMQLFSPYARQSSAIQELLQDSERVHLLAASIGPGLEARARQYLAANQAFKGYVLDRMGSFLVEQEIRKLDREITEEAQIAGVAPTRRYSPGYRDFSLKAQKIFVTLIAGGIPGLRLSPAGLIKPEKTVTAVKGIPAAP